MLLTNRRVRRTLSLPLAALVLPATLIYGQDELSLDPSNMPKIGAVDPRYVSFNVEMVEVTGGRFWKPYSSPSQPTAANTSANPEVGGASGPYEYRSPIDLTNPRLRKLAAALGPSYMRVSGTWQNSTYFQNDDKPALAQPPEGFKSVLTRAEWKNVIDFAHATDADLVTSFAISQGTRDAKGVWTSAQAKALLDYTREAGGTIAAAEFMNEPTFAALGGAPEGYDAVAYARDAHLFGDFIHRESPNTIFLGPGGVGEGLSLAPAGMKMKLLASEDLLKQTGPIFGAFSYHFYGAVSHRCMGTITIDQALTDEWLNRTNIVEAFYADLRDKYLPGKPLWLNETGEAACGGDPFAAQFIDSFRFLNQLGTLAQKSVSTVMHNTLAASDYGLLNEKTLEPRPNYWSALLWKRTMGTVVLDPHLSSKQNLKIYSQCLSGSKGGVAVLALNLDPAAQQSIRIPLAGEIYTLTASSMTSTQALLNGVELHVASDGSMPSVAGKTIAAGPLQLSPASINFLTFPNANNQACK